MKYYSIIITVALIVVCFLYLGEDTDTGEIVRENASLTEKNKVLQQENDSLQIEIKDKLEIVDGLQRRHEALEDTQNIIHIHHETTRKPFYTAPDTGLAVIISGQCSPSGY